MLSTFSEVSFEITCLTVTGSISVTAPVSVFVIDYKLQIIPNRLVLTIFEVGLVFAFISGMSNFSLFIDKILGMLAGGGIFLLITVIGGFIAGKEAMGFGDVKLMGALGLIFGLVNIVMIAVVSFLIGAIISIILLATKKKKTDEYIPLLKMFTLGMYQN